MTKIKNLNTTTFFTEAKESTSISGDRKDLLLDIADSIVDEFKDREKLSLNFICTHNSRRSQIAQVWSFFAIEYFNLGNIFSFSGGTEVTAFHRNTVRTLQEVGFNFNVVDFSHQNPKYLISFKDTKKSIIGYSKTFDDPHNSFPYIAITTCDSADENCPFIPDALERFHLPFTDPKFSDNTDLTSETYLKTNQDIAGEIFIIFEEVKRQLNE
ncbi:arsenate reductase [Tenacibaculum holothuriorum]|uniref:Arsenate reductase n=1 Tax=Tenacibaculum holothuriorum TaxID=1635173 RepID=A0A1Y2PBP4_9FLAO|nr:hypothetical protein [Tenacibaculum holothuriorum]OSY87875.1 arsenate reductase [Tenacibaculum holothuriorum]